MAGDERGHELVAQLGRTHRRAVLVGRGKQQREHVGAIGSAVVLPTALVDQRIDQRVGLREQRLQAAERPAAAHQPLQPRGWRRQQREGALGELEDRREQLAQLVQPRTALEAEDRAQHDLEREPLQAGVQLDRLLARPVGELALGQLAHQTLQRVHALAVERRQEQLALLHVGRLVQQDHRVATDQRFEDPRALAGVQDVGRRHQHFLDLVGVREDHERRLAEEADLVALAVARAIAIQDGGRARPGAECLQGGRHPWAGGKLGLRGTAHCGCSSR